MSSTFTRPLSSEQNHSDYLFVAIAMACNGLPCYASELICAKQCLHLLGTCQEVGTKLLHSLECSCSCSFVAASKAIRSEPSRLLRSKRSTHHPNDIRVLSQKQQSQALAQTLEDLLPTFFEAGAASASMGLAMLIMATF